MRLNRRQAIVVYVALALLLGMFIVPPFVIVYPQGATSSAGYWFIGESDGSVDVARLVVQCCAVTVAAAGFVFAFRDRN